MLPTFYEPDIMLSASNILEKEMNLVPNLKKSSEEDRGVNIVIEWEMSW